MAIATKEAVKPTVVLSTIIPELQALQRQRAVYIKSMIMVGNRLQAIVAGTMGYHSGLTETERKTLFTKAAALIKHILKAALIKHILKEDQDHELSGIVLGHTESIDALAAMRKPIEEKMEQLAAELPVAAWVLEPKQKGFGLPSLAVVIGEAGDLSNYANPAKLWARFGCHPYEKRGETHMGSTWKSRSRKPGVVKLSADDWEAFGYSPRRRSIAYLIGENLMKQNGGGPYRRRYDVKKAEAARMHDNWTPMHCHLHGMLLAAKLLLRELWAEWNGRPDEGIWKG